MTALDPTDAAAVLGGAGDAATVAAVVVAALVYVGDRQSRRRRQAEQVSAWFALDGPPLYAGDPDRWRLHVRNSSDQMVRRVSVQPVVDGEESQGFDPLPPGAEETVPCSTHLVVDAGEDPYGAALVLTFTDAAGRRWRVDPRGRLRRIPEDPEE